MRRWNTNRRTNRTLVPSRSAACSTDSNVSNSASPGPAEGHAAADRVVVVSFSQAIRRCSRARAGLSARSGRKPAWRSSPKRSWASTRTPSMWSSTATARSASSSRSASPAGWSAGSWRPATIVGGRVLHPRRDRSHADARVNPAAHPPLPGAPTSARHRLIRTPRPRASVPQRMPSSARPRRERGAPSGPRHARRHSGVPLQPAAPCR
jgi:hypothetical protein